MTMLLTPAVVLADHSRTHPLLHDMNAMLASRRKPTDRQYVDSLNTMGPIRARMFDETRRLTGNDRRAANREYLDRARLQEAFQALSNSASNAREQERFAEQRLLQPDLPF